MVEMRGPRQRLIVKDQKTEGGASHRDHEGSAGEVNRELTEGCPGSPVKLPRRKKTLFLFIAA